MHQDEHVPCLVFVPLWSSHCCGVFQVAHLNMDIRSRIEWASLWGILADHFGTVGSISGNTSVAMYTVDCLRQLALKFLDKVQTICKKTAHSYVD